MQSFLEIKKARGNARFETLMKIFDIKNNFVSDINEIYQRNINTKNNYEKINRIISEEKLKCLSILEKVLNSDYTNNKKSYKYKKKISKKKIKGDITFLNKIFSIRIEKSKKVIRILGIKIKVPV